ncbi:RsmB/NOP family class I SAM-dependent RNA methyltransferase [Sinimarinibacterium flocculans]|uniref:16S rRNA (Cytosine967-C5)-methyltransferase n=1 Tax=Sinimarinibacterium flocculans TaxID=985250 RepID=A0A318EBE7_9GAMM|nr:RsmB/NOP family class I SAM-dependent RNA methyltransferase [Sinimarinibacterium flocculans]PXV69833.1 16S rRNA (cytosine967-C5)-methyltransferase [Sinimarinibacterium flocculans]
MSRPRIFPAQWQLACEVLGTVLREGRAADRLLQATFRERRAMGGRDRARVTELVYGSLRNLRRLQRVAGRREPAALCAVHALDTGMSDAESLTRLGVADAAALAARLAQFDATTLTPAEALNLPDTVYAAWDAAIGAGETRALAAALAQQAPVDLRVNALKCAPEQAIEALAAANVDAGPTPWAPLGLRLAGRAPLQQLAAFRDGWIEPQDEGSQLLALLVGARPGERIADWCAGAGGKTLALAAAMRDSGELWAIDIDAQRLQRLGPRLQRAGVGCVRVHALDTVPDETTFDAVLVDAPCSATGTWRRQPEARLKPLDVAALAAQQRQILERAARHVRAGGRLVYGTCSLLDAENAAVVEAFLAGHPSFEPVDAGDVLAAQGVRFPGRYLQLWPHRHGTDGFFGAVLRRVA